MENNTGNPKDAVAAAALMPFKRATSGEAKVTQVTVPIASLED